VNKQELDAAVKEIRELEDHDARQRAMDRPDFEQVFGDPAEPGMWRYVYSVIHGCVTYYTFGTERTISQEKWAEWVRKPGIVNITAKLS